MGFWAFRFSSEIENNPYWPWHIPPAYLTIPHWSFPQPTLPPIAAGAAADRDTKGSDRSGSTLPGRM